MPEDVSIPINLKLFISVIKEMKKAAKEEGFNKLMTEFQGIPDTLCLFVLTDVDRKIGVLLKKDDIDLVLYPKDSDLIVEGDTDIILAAVRGKLKRLNPRTNLEEYLDFTLYDAWRFDYVRVDGEGSTAKLQKAIKLVTSRFQRIQEAMDRATQNLNRKAEDSIKIPSADQI